MMTEAVKRAIITKAEKLNISYEARTIATVLGTSTQKKHGLWWKFENKELIIEYDDYGDNTHISRKGKEYAVEFVYSTQLGQITRARLSNDWIDALHEVYKEAEKIVQQKDQESKEQEEKAIEENWSDTTSNDFEVMPQAEQPKVQVKGPMEVDQETFDKVVNYVRDAVWTKEGFKNERSK